MGKLAGSVGNQGFVFTPGMGPPRVSQLETKAERRQKEKSQSILRAELEYKEKERLAQEEIECIYNRLLPSAAVKLRRHDQDNLIGRRLLTNVRRLSILSKMYELIKQKPLDERARWLKPHNL